MKLKKKIVERRKYSEKILKMFIFEKHNIGVSLNVIKK